MMPSFSASRGLTQLAWAAVGWRSGGDAGAVLEPGLRQGRGARRCR